jgi:peptidoglycan/xylan/chitin deacetylase (PgdA/CDA1 family)
MTPNQPLSVLKRLKRGTLGAARFTGVLGFTRETSWRQRRLLILGYHGVSAADEHLWDGELYIPPALLRDRFRMLRDGGYRVLPLSEAVDRLYDGSLPPRAVALTFDDGATDFRSVAVPLLEEFGFPATVYLTSYYCKVQRPVFNTVLRYIFWKSSTRVLDTAGLTASGERMALATLADREAAFTAILRHCTEQRLSGLDKDGIVAEAAARLGFDYQGLLRRRLLHLMSPDEVAALPRGLVDVQLHTHRHRVPVEAAAFEREIVENRRIIQELTNAPIATHFCYPSGVTHPSFPAWLTRLGVTSATTCFSGMASAASDRLLLPRLIDTVNTSPLEFESWLTGASAFLPRRAVRANAPS